jgi:hypothetical protein
MRIAYFNHQSTQSYSLVCRISLHRPIVLRTAPNQDEAPTDSAANLQSSGIGSFDMAGVAED